jgi:hypothetical protein
LARLPAVPGYSGPARPIIIPGRRPTFSDSGGMAVPPFESQVCRPTVTLGRPGTGSCLVPSAIFPNPMLHGAQRPAVPPVHQDGTQADGGPAAGLERPPAHTAPWTPRASLPLPVAVRPLQWQCGRFGMYAPRRRRRPRSGPVQADCKRQWRRRHLGLVQTRTGLHPTSARSPSP